MHNSTMRNYKLKKHCFDVKLWANKKCNLQQSARL